LNDVEVISARNKMAWNSGQHRLHTIATQFKVFLVISRFN